MLMRVYACYDRFSFDLVARDFIVDEKHPFRTIMAIVIALTIDFGGDTFVKFYIRHLLFSFYRRDKYVIRPLTNIR